MKHGLLVLLVLLLLSGCVVVRQYDPEMRLASGEKVAAELNARYDDERMACDNAEAAYDCDGVLVRVVQWSPDYRFWNQNPNDAYYGVSFSYLRRDVNSRRLFGDHTRVGFIFKPARDWGKEGGYAPTLKCVFPYDAITGPGRGEFGCGASPEYPVDSRPCYDQQILTKEAFITHYEAPGKEFGQFIARAKHQCSFPVDQQAFALSILARNGGELEIESRRYMELMIAEWPQDIPGRLPLEALFYDPSTPGNALEQARCEQVDFRVATGRTLPIVRLELDPVQLPFSYREEDQDQGVARCDGRATHESRHAEQVRGH